VTRKQKQFVTKEDYIETTIQDVNNGVARNEVGGI
jgi:hypothetical protein